MSMVINLFLFIYMAFIVLASVLFILWTGSLFFRMGRLLIDMNAKPLFRHTDKHPGCTSNH